MNHCSCLQSTVHSSGSQVQIEFTPILRGYITTAYSVNTILRGQISPEAVFKQDLTELDPITNWKVSYDSTSGAYHISPDDVDEIHRPE